MDGIEDLKKKGNDAFGSGDVAVAVEFYSNALSGSLRLAESGQVSLESSDKLKEVIPSLLSNRSASLCKLEKFAEALNDANRAIQLKPSWVKLYHRKAQALLGLGLVDEARDTYSAAHDIEPSNSFIKKSLDTLDEQTGRKSAHAKINEFVEKHGSIKGCPTKLSLTMFEVQDCLGEGNYSSVFKAMFKSTNETFAIKMVDKTKANRMSRRHPNLFNELQMEKKLLQRLNHVNIIRLYFTMQDSSAIYYVTELASAGELWSQLMFGRNALVSIRPSLCAFYMAQLTNALGYLEDNGIVHRDIKPENMMLCTNGRECTLKLIDFGTAFDTIDTELNGPNFVGTPEYMSPEAIEAKSAPSFALDIWAFGCTLFQLHSGKIPFKGNSPYLTFLKTQALSYDIPNYFSNDLQDLVKRIFLKDPSERIGAKDRLRSIKAHPYFSSVDFNLLLQSQVTPVPTLAELCHQVICDTFIRVELSESNQKSVVLTKPKHLPKWASETGIFSVEKIGVDSRNSLFGLFAQRMILGYPYVFKLFYPNKVTARFHRTTTDHGVAGMSEQEEGKFTKPFILVQLGSLKDTTPETIEKTIRRINTLQPTPKLLVCSGALGNAQENKAKLGLLDEKIPIICCPDGRNDYTKEFGETYYSFHVSGIFVIVIDSFLLCSENEEECEKHAKWFEHQILTGKLCARHVVLVSHHAWLPIGTEQPCNGLFVPEKIVSRFLDKLQEASTQIILCGGANQGFIHTRKAQTDIQQKLYLTNTSPLGTNPCLRVVRVQGSHINTDTYLLDELPPWIALDKEEEATQDDGEEDDGPTRFSDISSDSSDDES
uniref:Protein kinase domain-containing protein n=1 Tax=Mucochytrium quahogii TaxID=96639 RepID=A0A7S2SNM6_9STRA|mmetsp:Transcript_10675/g.20031  ORF Transcript_10675/g.20031 Transcript_10675/m.20031 type:complete len:825 (+) Transcript_10675:106-2580(+)|eukprot:CAMPEP_0203761458 /NCGR_PEP_ID=MMETSP0098-20131031/14543_1 /ASSEMBLY_ACC=CAM_ASM_000208 /TAXON_ID=96639 /ORGANISM=" , Strain NY0313808BC1" /LENGTH=824 /DNA_ID=CAMNT_0050655463 /DNA_START=67 /DNA_END=2541 /DNA_ORIENTATION=-